jgi:hypothetical protein
MSRLEVIPRMRVREGKLDGFKRQVAESGLWSAMPNR